MSQWINSSVPDVGTPAAFVQKTALLTLRRAKTGLKSIKAPVGLVGISHCTRGARRQRDASQGLGWSGARVQARLALRALAAAGPRRSHDRWRRGAATAGGGAGASHNGWPGRAATTGGGAGGGTRWRRQRRTAGGRAAGAAGTGGAGLGAGRRVGAGRKRRSETQLHPAHADDGGGVEAMPTRRSTRPTYPRTDVLLASIWRTARGERGSSSPLPRATT
jgi:hypothetical protein